MPIEIVPRESFHRFASLIHIQNKNNKRRDFKNRLARLARRHCILK